jgi:hypothetical protein
MKTLQIISQNISLLEMNLALPTGDQTCVFYTREWKHNGSFEDHKVNMS